MANEDSWRKFGTRKERTVNLTLQVGDAEKVSFTKTGYGDTAEAAEADAYAKLEADAMYARMIRRRGVKVVQ